MAKGREKVVNTTTGEEVIEFANEVTAGYVFNLSLTDEEIRGDVNRLIDTKLAILRAHVVKFATKRRGLLSQA